VLLPSSEGISVSIRYEKENEMAKVTYKHYGLENGASEYFPKPDVFEADREIEGWPPETVKVEFFHDEQCSCVVFENGESVTVDVEGFGYDVDRGEFLLTSEGIKLFRYL
jgi:hypothetical protein